MRIINSLVALLGILTLTQAQTPDAMTKIDMDQVPKNILKANEANYPEEKVDQWYFYNGIYSAQVKNEAMNRYSRFNSEGLILEERYQKKWETASERLKSAKDKTQYKYWDVVEYYEIFENDQLSYYFLKMKNEGDIKTIYFDSDAKLEDKSMSGY